MGVLFMKKIFIFTDEDEIVEMSSLDVAKVGRQTLKRRASDSVKSLAVLKKAAAVRKGSLSPCDDVSGIGGCVAKVLMKWVTWKWLGKV